MPEAGRPLRLGIVGCGRLAEAGYVPAARIAGLRVAALADPDPERRAALVAVCDAASPPATFTDVDELLAEGGVDAVVVASPPERHEDAATACARAGIPALVEKPPAPDAAGAERIAALAPAPWIGFNRRFSLGRGVAGVLPQGGAIDLELRYRRFSWAPVSVRDPALTDLAPHLVDLALVAGIGAPRRVRAQSSRPERITIELTGERGSAAIRCACDRPHRERLEVRDGAGRRVRSRRLGGTVRGALARFTPGPHPLVASLAAQVEAFAGAIRGAAPAPDGGEGPDLATAAEGAAVMRVIAACAQSLALGGAAVEPAEGAGVS